METTGTMRASTMHGIGIVTQEGAPGELHLTCDHYNPPIFTPMFNLGNGWEPWTDQVMSANLNPSEQIRLRVKHNQDMSDNCTVNEEGDHAVFTFSWQDPNVPSVTIDVHDHTIQM